MKAQNKFCLMVESVLRERWIARATPRRSPLIKVTGAVIGDQVVNAEGVIRLAQLPGRDVLLSQVAGAIAAPMANVAGLFDAPLRDIAGLVQALADKGSAA